MSDAERPARRRYVLCFDVPAVGNFPAKVRYLATRARKHYRGMYRNRRVVNTTPATWTDDRERAYTFGSPSEGREYARRWYGPAAMARYRFEPK